MENLDLELMCNEIENKIVTSTDLVELLKKHFDKDEIDDDGLRIIQSSLAIVLDIQKDILGKFTNLIDNTQFISK